MSVREIEKEIVFITRALEQNSNYILKGFKHPYYSEQKIKKMEEKLITLQKRYNEIENNL